VPSDEVRRATAAGLDWLAQLANRDGGLPTFCRGWGRLPFDTSCPDITAHAIRAAECWSPFASGADGLPPHDAASQRRMLASARRYLVNAQSADGSWCPLWFGNEHHAHQSNPTYGTARVVLATLDRRGTEWLLACMRADGGVGGGPGLTPSIEETALTVEALARVAAESRDPTLRSRATAAVTSGVAWLLEHTAAGTRFPAAPIGLYFAKLWYDEELYPLAFTVAALERAALTRDSSG
jgi:squalene-hopene/tetraprenyl-beta-curcumene cyclase